MSSAQITTVEELHQYLQLAMQLEHAMIPPYLLALYSIHPGTNPDATNLLRTVVVEEMLHLTLAANLLNAVGGTPDLTAPNFVPQYPMSLTYGETEIMVDLQRFSQEAVEAFLKIEQASKAPNEASRLLRTYRRSFIGQRIQDPDLDYYSIREFYEEIARGIDYLAQAIGPKALFTGNAAKQATSEYYYSSGRQLFPVTDLGTAKQAINLICEQDGVLDGRIYDTENELAHYYRIVQLKLGKYYKAGDQPDRPSGPALSVDWEAIYPIQKNPRVRDYGDSDLYETAIAFNQSYAQFLALLTKAYNDQPELLLDAVPQMFRLREKITHLIHTPIPRKRDVNAAPTFEIEDILKG